MELNGKTSRAYVTDTKTGDDGIVPVGPTARAAYEELMKEGVLSQVGTNRYWELVRRAAWMAGIPAEKARPYALRHSAATHLIERGVPERFVSELMRHRDPRALWGYTIPSDDVLRKAIELL